MLAIRKLDQVIKPTIKLTKERENRAAIKTKYIHSISPIMTEIIRATYSLSTTY